MDRTEKYALVRKLRGEGMTQKKIAELLELDQSWVSRVLRMPEDRELPKWGGNRPSKLNEDQKKELIEMLEQGAEAFGYEGNVWSSKRIKALIADKFGVEYHTEHIPKLLKKLGFSYQKPKLQDVRRDPERVKEFAEKRLPELKKSVGRRPNNSLCR